MFYVWLNGVNLKRFKNLMKAKLFAINYAETRHLDPENDDFLITNPCDYEFETIDVFNINQINL